MRLSLKFLIMFAVVFGLGGLIGVWITNSNPVAERIGYPFPNIVDAEWKSALTRAGNAYKALSEFEMIEGSRIFPSYPELRAAKRVLASLSRGNAGSNVYKISRYPVPAGEKPTKMFPDRPSYPFHLPGLERHLQNAIAQRGALSIEDVVRAELSEIFPNAKFHESEYYSQINPNRDDIAENSKTLALLMCCNVIPEGNSEYLGYTYIESMSNRLSIHIVKAGPKVIILTSIGTAQIVGDKYKVEDKI